MRTQHWLLGAIVINAAPFTLTACEIHSISSNKSVGSGGSGGATATATASSGSGGATASSSSGSGGAAPSSGSGGATASSSSGGATASSSSGSGGAGSSSGSGGGVPCAPEAMSIYAISTDKQLYRLDYASALPWPWTNTLVGALACPTSADPYSIAIDRSGQAWVVYTDGNLFTVDTTTAACAATAFVPGQHGYTTFSMAFAADAPGSDVETLHVSGSGESGSTVGRATINRSTLTLTPLGAYDNPLVTSPVHLTGTSDGNLFGGFLWNNSYFFATLDPTSAHVLDVTSAPSILLKGLSPTTRHSVIPWGTYFWVFIEKDGGMRSYFYHHAVGISTYYGPAGITPVPFLTLSASTCATANQLP